MGYRVARMGGAQAKDCPTNSQSDNWKEFLRLVRELVRIYLLMDERDQMSEVSERLPCRRTERYEVRKWDASIFNREPDESRGERRSESLARSGEPELERRKSPGAPAYRARALVGT